MLTTKNKMSTKTLVLGAVMTAMVILFQLLATYTSFFGPFSTAMALIPIVIGAALCGPWVGTWLGLIFGIVVLVTGGANLFFMFDVPGTFVTVLAKGMACGLVAGFVYKAFEKKGRFLAVTLAAIACPITNTAVFLLGCYTFFMDSATQIAEACKLEAAGMGVFGALAMANFLLELATNIVLSPAIVRLLNIRSKQK